MYNHQTNFVNNFNIKCLLRFLIAQGIPTLCNFMSYLRSPLTYKTIYLFHIIFNNRMLRRTLRKYINVLIHFCILITESRLTTDLSWEHRSWLYLYCLVFISCRFTISSEIVIIGYFNYVLFLSEYFTYMWSLLLCVSLILFCMLLFV